VDTGGLSLFEPSNVRDCPLCPKRFWRVDTGGLSLFEVTSAQRVNVRDCLLCPRAKRRGQRSLSLPAARLTSD